MEIATLNLLQDIVRREGRSLLQYVSEADPWISPADKEAMARVASMAVEERNAMVALAGALAKKRHRLPAYPGAYPMSFTTINFATLHYLIPLLIDYQKHGIAELERDVLSIGDEEAAGLVQKFLEMKRRHLQILTELAAAKPAPV